MPVSQTYFFHKDGSFLRPGDHWQQKDLAATLDKIARQGKDGFYKGEVADEIVAEMGRHGGLISLAGLANYKVI